MPGFILHLNAQVQCGHGGVATATQPMPRVLVSGQPIVTTFSPYAVAGCAFASPPGPCATGFWAVGATRVFSLGRPIAINAGVGACLPNGAPLVSAGFQTRVTAM
jgi:hypothetical protein